MHWWDYEVDFLFNTYLFSAVLLSLYVSITDVVDRLAKEGKQIEALSFAHSFGIMDRVQPIPLLKSYLKEARRTAQSILRTGNSSAAAQVLYRLPCILNKFISVNGVLWHFGLTQRFLTPEFGVEAVRGMSFSRRETFSRVLMLVLIV